MIPLLKCKQNQDPLVVIPVDQQQIDRHPLVIPVAVVDPRTLLDSQPLVIPVVVVDPQTLLDRHPLVIPVAVDSHPLVITVAVDQWTPVLLPHRLHVRI